MFTLLPRAAGLRVRARAGVRQTALLIVPALALVLSNGAYAQDWNHDPAAANGPLAWGTAFASFATCGAKATDKFVEVGAKQTPIDIDSTLLTRTTLPALTFLYQDNPLEVENTGHVVEVVYGAGSKLRIGGVVTGSPGSLGWTQSTDEYQLLQFHFHAPSEHTIDGKSYDMELHLVHQNQLGDLAVVGILMKQSTDASTLVDRIMSLAPLTEGTGKVDGATLNVRQLLPDSRGYYMYSGSLTTPPCTEGVRWFVLKSPVSVSSYAVQQAHSIISHFPGYGGYANNNRPVAPLHGRAVLADR